ncbi:SprT family zinc-dependent metalloprotease [Rhizobium brockwellii]|uniref:SprT family zinc-dependent metalloprotease n=1 Tax=Rhizobium brockwellii TaxID=3019932 RepID=A0ABU3YN37_9HYPH|nr:SprT family zinc-dependent metalloprotease [Rhizobium brockwellii]MDV4180210.1 SprT family zinc-dependent metalloprotease [Rhizobium brockwellii]MDV4187132.1 SprT family zinc-dependent metalloprotease [Rhizobium brockwellii]
MPMFRIGEREIEYSLRRSATATKAKLSITLQSFELLVPEQATESQIDAVLQRRRAWILATVQHMQDRAKAQTRVYRFVSGAKIPYRGRMTKLSIEPFDGSLVEVSFRNGFQIRKPQDLSPDSTDAVIESALRLWLRRRVRDDARDFVRRHGDLHGLKPRGIQIKDQKHMWGSCGQDRQINLNWHLIFAPKPVLEYAVVHEMCHLKHRNHEPEFWNLVGRVLPDWEARKAWLDKNEYMLGWEKVEAST